MDLDLSIRKASLSTVRDSRVVVVVGCGGGVEGKVAKGVVEDIVKVVICRMKNIALTTVFKDGICHITLVAF